MANVYVRSGAGGAGTGADWTNAYTTLAAAFAAKAAGDSFWVSEDHAETQASAMTLTSPGSVSNPCFIYCVNHAGTVPPVSADLATTATITTTGANNMVFAGVAYCYGIQFNVGTGAVSQGISLAAAFWHYKNCQLNKLGTTANASAIAFGGSSGSTAYKLVLENTTVKFGATGDSIAPRSARCVWKDTATAIQGATLPTILFTASASLGGTIRCEGVDFSALGSGKTLVSGLTCAQDIHFKDCKLGASVTVSATPSGPGSSEVLVSRTDSSGTNYITQKYNYMGTQTDETVVVRTSGASDGTTLRSMKLTTTANAKWFMPLEAVPVAIWQDSTSAATATIEGIWSSTVVPTNDQVWFDLEYLGASGSPLGSFATGTKADGLATGSNLTASTQAWDSLATSRANSTAYSLGDIRKVSSNSGRLFICTTAGTSSGSLPGGYATAVDGDVIADGSANFRAMVRFKQTINFTAAQKGAVYAYVKAAKASDTFYIDPLITLA